MENAIRGRFAPSPSGEMHLGNAWTGLLAWLQIRAMNGAMVLRIEDLDPDRSKAIFTAQIIEDLHWLGLDWGEGPDIGGAYAPYCQDDRRATYDRALKILTDKGLVYPCYCSRAELRSIAQAPHAGEATPNYMGACANLTSEQRAGKSAEGRSASLRLAVPQGSIVFEDLCCGEYEQNIAQAVGDFIIRRADGIHAYQLAVVVDDAAMQISHVLRGADLLDSTPRQLLLYRLLGLQAPCFTHVPLFVGEDGQRLSKRHGDVSIASLRRKGVSAPTIIGFLAWKANLQDRWEAITAGELIKYFAISKLPRTTVVITQSDMQRFV